MKKVVSIMVLAALVAPFVLLADVPSGPNIKKKWHLHLLVAWQWHSRSFDGNGWGCFESPIFDDEYHWRPTKAANTNQVRVENNSVAAVVQIESEDMMVEVEPGNDVVVDAEIWMFNVVGDAQAGGQVSFTTLGTNNGREVKQDRFILDFDGEFFGKPSLVILILDDESGRVINVNQEELADSSPTGPVIEIDFSDLSGYVDTENPDVRPLPIPREIGPF